MLKKIMQRSAAAVFLILVAQNGQALAAGDPEEGAKKIALCAACHGTDGKAVADIYPHLAGQWPAYLESALKAYRDGHRTGGMSAMMTPQATGLSDEDIADIAAYYSQQ